MTLKKDFIKLISVSLFSVIIFSAAMVCADDNKTNGSVSADDASGRLPGEPQTEFGYDGGFFLKSKDGNFKLQIGMAIQPWFFYNSEKLPIDDTVIGPTATHRTSQMSFGIRYSYVSFSGTIYDKIKISTGANYSTGGGDSMKINGAEVGYSIAKWMYLSLGMTGLPFDMSGSWSGSSRFLCEWPATTARADQPNYGGVTRPSFGAPGGLGFRLSGDISRTYYGIGVINGNENSHELNTNKKFSFGGQFGVNVLGKDAPGSQSDLSYSEIPRLTFNTGAIYSTSRMTYDKDDNDLANIKYMLSATIGTAFRYKGFSLTTEGYYRRMKISQYYGSYGSLPGARYNYTDIGYYGAIGYFVIPKKMELGVQGSQVFRQGPDNNVNQFGGGINYYIKDSNLKIQLSYMWTQDYGDVWGSDQNNIHLIGLVFSAQL